MARRQRISGPQWVVLVVGLPLMAISGIAYAIFGTRLAGVPEGHGVYDTKPIIAMIAATFTSQDTGPDLLFARISFAVLVLSTVASILIVARESRRMSGDSKLIERQHVLMDMSFWQVGDRGAWLDNGMHTGTVIQAHRRPFDFEGKSVDAFAGAPGLVLQDDAGGYGTVDNGMLYRIAGTKGPSGTIDSIRDEMNAAVDVGTGTSWIDPQGDVQEGTILEIKYEPFEVGGKHIDASRSRPGYVIARSPDGVHVGVSDALREGT